MRATKKRIVLIASIIVGVPIVVAALIGAAGCGAQRPIVRAGDSGEQLAVTRVVMFQHGLGQFERRGTLEGSSVDLSVRSEHVDDVLRSLTVMDRSGARISSVRLLPSHTGDATSTLRIGLDRDGAHDLRISYVAVVPGWKPTYRLVATQDNRVRIQGLAVVDNHTGEAWRRVALVLSTDVPLSFEYAVRARRTLQRPRFGPDGRLVAVTEERLEGIPDVQRAYAMARGQSTPEWSNRAGEMRGERDQQAPLPVPGPRTPSARQPGAAPEAEPPRPESALLAIDGHEGQQSFTLQSGAPFSLGMGESGLVPFVDAETTGGRVLLYKPAPGGARSQTRPFRAIMFRNPSEAPLLTGPVTFYSESAYLGDGVTATIPGRAHAFVAYGIEPSVEVNAETEQAEDEVRPVALVGGVLRVELRQIVRRRFHVTARAGSRDRLYVFAEAQPGFEPRNLPDGTVTTSAGYFLRAALPGDTTLELVRRNTSEANLAADPTHPYVGALLTWLTADGSHVAQHRRLRAIVDRLEDIRLHQVGYEEDLRVQQAALEEQREALGALRDVPDNAALRRTIGQGVARLVTAVDAASRRMVEANAERLALRQEWYALLRALTVQQ